jgi:hypothetical protein
MHANPDLLLYAGSPQFEPTSGTIVGGYGAVHVRPNPNWKAYNTQHGTGRFVSFADDLAGDDSMAFGFWHTVGLLVVAGAALTMLSSSSSPSRGY